MQGFCSTLAPLALLSVSLSRPLICHVSALWWICACGCWDVWPWCAAQGLYQGCSEPAEGDLHSLGSALMPFWSPGWGGSCLDARALDFAWDWFLVGSSWIWCCFLGFYSAWIPGLAEAGGLSGCWWACPSVEVDLLVCLDAGCCWVAVWVNWLWHQQPESGSSSAQSEGGLDWASWLGDGVMHGYCWDSDGFCWSSDGFCIGIVEILMDFWWSSDGFCIGIVEILMGFWWSSDGSCIGIVGILMGFCWSSDGFCIGIVEILMDFWWSSDGFCIGIVEILMGFCWSSDGFCIGIVEILIDFWWIYHVFCTVLLRSWWVMYGFCWKSDGVCMDLMKSLKVPAWICLVFWCDLHGFTWISGSVFW